MSLGEFIALALMAVLCAVFLICHERRLRRRGNINRRKKR